MTSTIAVQSGVWNDPAVWSAGVPTSSVRAIIPTSVTVFMDGTDNFARELVVQGTLDILESPGVNKSLTTDWVHVNSGGLFKIGTTTDRYDANTFELTLTGDDPTQVFNVEGVGNPISNNNGFLMVAGGGRLQFFGEEKLSFTKLSATVESGSNLIFVEKQIDRNFDGELDASDGEINWSVGDQIVIASTSRNYRDEEVRTIVSIADVGDGTQVILLDSNLNKRHYGEIEVYQNDSRTYEIDMRAEVAVLNRSIKIQGEASHDTDNSFGDRARFNAGLGDGFGGHMMIMGTAGQVLIDNVQFERMGQTARLGRYPVHWHIGGDRTGDFLRGASITNSNNRGVTIHASDNVRIQDVVLHDIHGHGFFMENGVETGNLFLSNIAFGIHKVGRSAAVGDFAPDLNDPFIVDTHDHVGQNANRFLSSAAYWMTNPDNTWFGNISAGCEGTGFWFIFPDFPIGDSVGDPQYSGVRANRTNMGIFDHNSSHSSPIGFNMDRGPDIEVPVGAALDSPFFGRRFLPPSEPQFNYYTAFQHNIGIYQRGNIGNFFENRFADNFTGTFITFTQRITNTLYVGHSRGNSNPSMPVTGHSLYDGANTLTGTHFAGFTASNAHNFRPHGSALRHASHVFSNTSFEDDGSALSISIGTQTGGSTHNSAFQTAASAVYDNDGSLTGPSGGGAGYTVVADHPFFYDSDDTKPNGWNAWLSEDTYSMLNFLASNSNVDVRFTSPDGDTYTWTNTIGQFGFNTHVKNNSGDYIIEFPQGVNSVQNGFEVWHHNRVGPSGSTVICFKDIGLTIAPNLNELSSLTALRNSGSSAYYRAGADLWVKFFNFNNRLAFNPTVIEDENDPPVAVNDLEETVSGVAISIDVLDNDFDPNGDPLAVIPMGTTVTTFLDEFQTPLPPNGWRYLWNAGGSFGNEANYEELVWDTWRYRANSSDVVPWFSSSSVHPGLGTSQAPGGIERFAIAEYTVPENGVYAIDNSFVTVNEDTLDGVNFQAHVTGGSVFTLEDLFLTQGDFDGTIGYLTAGQKIYIGVGSNLTAGADATNWDFSIIRADNTPNGLLFFEPDGTVMYAPDNGFVGTDAFVYEISDGRGGRDSAVVSIDVAGAAVDLPAESYEVVIGGQSNQNISGAAESDNDYLRVASVAARPFFEKSIEVELTATSPDFNPSSIRFEFEGRVSTINVIQQINVFNNDTGLFQTVDSRSAPLMDQNIQIDLTGDLQRFVDQHNGEVRVRVALTTIGPVFGFPWTLYVDRAVWQIN
ncbi:MAG: G8 domain-containing protein [Planctomycetota bacterium]